MKKIISKVTYLLISSVALIEKPILAMDPSSHQGTISSPQLKPNQAAIEIGDIRAKLESQAKLGMIYQKEALEALNLMNTQKTLLGARSALEQYNEQVKTKEKAKSIEKSIGTHHGLDLKADDLEQLLESITRHTKDCMKKVGQLEQEALAQINHSGGGQNDAVLIQQLREEIIKLGGNARAIESIALPPLNEPFIYISKHAIAVNPLTAQATVYKKAIKIEIEKLEHAIQTGAVQFSKPKFTSKWTQALNDLKALVEHKDLDWVEFSNLAIQIRNQDTTKFAGNKISNNPLPAEFTNLVQELDHLLDMKTSLEASQNEEEYENKQRELQAADGMTTDIDATLDELLLKVLPKLQEVIKKVKAKPDVPLARQIEEIEKFIETRNLLGLAEFFKTTVPKMGIKTLSFIQRGMLFLAKDEDWKQFNNIYDKYNSQIDALGRYQKTLILLQQMRYGKKDYQNILHLINAHNPTDANLQNILKIPDIFALSHVDREKTMEYFKNLKNKYEKDKTDFGKLVMQLYYSYFQVFDSATKLYFEENPPLKPLVSSNGSASVGGGSPTPPPPHGGPPPPSPPGHHPKGS